MRTSHLYPLAFVFLGACGEDAAVDSDDNDINDAAVDSDGDDINDAAVDSEVDDLAEVAVDSDGNDINDVAVDSDGDDLNDVAVDSDDNDINDVAVDSDGDDINDVAVAAPAFYLTIAAIPEAMNGSRPSTTPDGELSFRLRANRSHVDLDVIARPGSGPFGPDDLELECLADGNAHVLPAVTAIAPDHLRVTVDDAHAFPDGAAIDCHATVTTAGGTASASYAFDAATLTRALDPFPADDVWLVLLRRDRDTIHVIDNGDGTSELRSTREPDDVDDFDAPFFEVGLMSRDHPEATAAIRAQLLAKVRAIVQSVYRLAPDGAPTADGVALRLYFEGDPGAPDPADYGSPDHRFSMIALTGDGDAEDQAGTTFGRAQIDWNNQDTEDDTVYGLGVWPAAIARTILRNAAGALLLGDIRPALGGTPFGAAPGDELFVGQEVDWVTLPDAVQGRAQRYELLVRFGSLALAAILSHEMGHSLGLVPFGAPPIGLFAGVETDWVVSLAPDAHIDIPGLNVMQTGASVNWLEAATGDLPTFEPLSWAYLRRQLVVGPQPD